MPTKRRPWIDWIHTARDQGALIRDYTKWDDQPASPAAAREVDAARQLDRQHRAVGPIYVNLDAEMQEAKLPEPLPPIDATRYMPPVVQRARRPNAIKQAADLLLKAPRTPLILAGRVSRNVDAWNARVAARRGARRARRSPT